MDFSSLENVKFLTEEFKRKDVGGFGVARPVQLKELQDFIWLFSRENSGQGVTSTGCSGTVTRPLARTKAVVSPRSLVASAITESLVGCSFARSSSTALMRAWRSAGTGLPGNSLGQRAAAVSPMRASVVSSSFSARARICSLGRSESRA